MNFNPHGFGIKSCAGASFLAPNVSGPEHTDWGAASLFISLSMRICRFIAPYISTGFIYLRSGSRLCWAADVSDCRQRRAVQYMLFVSSGVEVMRRWHCIMCLSLGRRAEWGCVCVWGIRSFFQMPDLTVWQREDYLLFIMFHELIQSSPHGHYAIRFLFCSIFVSLK